MTASKIFLYFCLSFIGGIFLSSFLMISQIVILGNLIFGITLISVLFKYKKLVVVGFSLLFLALGIWRYQTMEIRSTKSEILNHNDLEKSITLIGTVLTEPKIKEKTTQLVITLNEILAEDRPLPVSGKVLVTINRYPEYKYGDKLKITGKLKSPPEDVDGFNYRNYLKKDGIYSTMAWPKIELIDTSALLSVNFYKYLFSFKNKLKESVNNFLSPPQSGLLEALFFGDEENIPKVWKDKFNLTGMRHITAVSGMNITIICALIFNFLLCLGLWRKQAFYFSIILIILYILMIGFPASAFRAGIMGLLFLTAQYFGRAASASRTIVFASAIMLFLNPFLLRFDVGFQLSFLAMMGLIYLQPAFLNVFKKVPDFLQIRYTLTATLSAQVFTLPILIYNFGRVSLTSPLTNILIVPTLPLVTIFGFIFSFVGMIFWPLGWILSWLVWLALSYIINVIDFFSRIPFASISIENVSWLWLVFSYLLLGIITWRLQERQKLKFLNY